jgi:hypothetical protein
VSAVERKLAEAGVARAASRLDRLEERLAEVERLAFAELDALARRVEAVELGLPSSRDLQQRRRAAIYSLRTEGWSVSAIAERVSMSRSRVAAIVQQAGVPTPPLLTAIDGRRYPARRNGAARG